MQNSGKKNQYFDFEHRNKVGISLDRDASSADEAAEVSRTRVVLRRDPTQPDGYFVLTSYPQR